MTVQSEQQDLPSWLWMTGESFHLPEPLCSQAETGEHLQLLQEARCPLEGSLKRKAPLAGCEGVIVTAAATEAGLNHRRWSRPRLVQAV